MITTIQTYKDIDSTAWSRLVQSSPTGTWFQMPEAYSFFADLPNVFRPFVVAVAEKGNGAKDLLLRAVCVGYITVEQNPIKQFFTRRAIIIGGPALVADCTSEEVVLLMETVKCRIKELGGAIYIETRNFNDYSRYRDGFEKAGFHYEPHLNFHVHTGIPWETTESHIGKHRRRYIRLSYRDGASVVESPSIGQVREYYDLLRELYTKKVKMPLLPKVFFEKLYQLESCKYLLVEFEGKIVGGAICMLLQGRGVYEWFACGKDGEYKNIYPSSVTKYAGMKFASDHGFPIFDMMGAGKPGVPYGVRDFKEEFGGELVEHGRYRFIAKPFLYRCGEIAVKIMQLSK